MEKIEAQHILYFLAVGILFSSCFSQHAFQTARTTKADDYQVGIGGNTGSTFYYEFKDVTVSTTSETVFGDLPIGDILVYARTGLSLKEDLGISFGFSGNLGLDYKFMLVGNHESKFVLSPGLLLNSNIFSFREFPLTIGLPVHLSYYTNDIAFFLTPRYSYQYKNYKASPGTERSVNVHRLGLSGGVELPAGSIKIIISANTNHALNTDFIEEEYEKHFYSLNLGLSYLIEGNKF